MNCFCKLPAKKFLWIDKQVEGWCCKGLQLPKHYQITEREEDDDNNEEQIKTNQDSKDAISSYLVCSFLKVLEDNRLRIQDLKSDIERMNNIKSYFNKGDGTFLTNTNNDQRQKKQCKRKRISEQDASGCKQLSSYFKSYYSNGSVKTQTTETIFTFNPEFKCYQCNKILPLMTVKSHDDQGNKKPNAGKKYKSCFDCNKWYGWVETSEPCNKKQKK